MFIYKGDFNMHTENKTGILVGFTVLIIVVIVMINTFFVMSVSGDQPNDKQPNDSQQQATDVSKDCPNYDPASAQSGEVSGVSGGADYAAAACDTVIITFIGTVDGVAFEGGSTSDPMPLVLGSNSFVPGFEDGLIGAKIGEVIPVNVTFPAEYKADLAGKNAVFTVTVTDILMAK